MPSRAAADRMDRNAECETDSGALRDDAYAARRPSDGRRSRLEICRKRPNLAAERSAAFTGAANMITLRRALRDASTR